MEKFTSERVSNVGASHPRNFKIFLKNNQVEEAMHNEITIKNTEWIPVIKCT